MKRVRRPKKVARADTLTEQLTTLPLPILLSLSFLNHKSLFTLVKVCKAWYLALTLRSSAALKHVWNSRIRQLQTEAAFPRFKFLALKHMNPYETYVQLRKSLFPRELRPYQVHPAKETPHADVFGSLSPLTRYPYSMIMPRQGSAGTTVYELGDVTEREILCFSSSAEEDSDSKNQLPDTEQKAEKEVPVKTKKSSSEGTAFKKTYTQGGTIVYGGWSIHGIDSELFLLREVLTEETVLPEPSSEKRMVLPKRLVKKSSFRKGLQRMKRSGTQVRKHAPRTLTTKEEARSCKAEYIWKRYELEVPQLASRDRRNRGIRNRIRSTYGHTITNISEVESEEVVRKMRAFHKSKPINQYGDVLLVHGGLMIGGYGGATNQTFSIEIYSKPSASAQPSGRSKPYWSEKEEEKVHDLEFLVNSSILKQSPMAETGMLESDSEEEHSTAAVKRSYHSAIYYPKKPAKRFPDLNRVHSSNRGKLYLFGGFEDQCLVDSLQAIDLLTGKVQNLTTCVSGTRPEARFGHSCVNIDAKMFICGGCNATSNYKPMAGDGSKDFQDMHFIDLSVHQDELCWTKVDLSACLINRRRVPISRCHSNITCGNSMLIFGGGRPSHVTNDLYQFDLSDLHDVKCQQVSLGKQNLPRKRQNHLSMWLPSRTEFIVFGGCLANQAAHEELGDTFVYSLDDGERSKRIVEIDESYRQQDENTIRRTQRVIFQFMF